MDHPKNCFFCLVLDSYLANMLIKFWGFTWTHNEDFALEKTERKFAICGKGFNRRRSCVPWTGDFLSNRLNLKRTISPLWLQNYSLKKLIAHGVCSTCLASASFLHSCSCQSCQMPRCVDGESVMPTTNYIHMIQYWFIFSGTSHLQVESLFLLSSLIFHDFTEESSTFTPVNGSVKRIFRTLLSRSRGTGSWNMDWMIRYKKKNHLERPLDFLHNKNQKFQEITWTCSLHNSWMSCFFLGTFLLKGLRRCQIWETNSRPRRSAKNHSAGEKHLQTGKLVDLNESHVNVSIP